MWWEVGAWLMGVIFILEKGKGRRVEGRGVEVVVRKVARGFCYDMMNWTGLER